MTERRRDQLARLEERRLVDEYLTLNPQRSEKETTYFHQLLQFQGLPTEEAALCRRKYEKYGDEYLVALLEESQRPAHPVAVATIKELLAERGYEIEEEVVEVETIPLTNSAVPLLSAVAMLAIVYMTSTSNFDFGIAAGRSAAINASIVITLVIRVIVLLQLSQYLEKQANRSRSGWYLAGALTGPWTLLVMGIKELMHNYGGKESRPDLLDDGLL